MEVHAEDFVGIQLVESCGPKKGDFHSLAVALWRVPHVLEVGADEKASIERLCLFLLISKNF